MSNMSFESADIEVEQITDLKVPQSVKILDISFSNIQDLDGFDFHPNLQKFIADYSQISSLKGFSSIRKCYSVSIKETPLAKTKNFRISLLILFGDSLTLINGAYITDRLREQANAYPEVARKLINYGWIAEYPVPSDERFEELKQQYFPPPEEVQLQDFNSNISIDLEIEEEEVEDYDTNKVLQEYILMEQKVFLKTLEEVEEYMENEVKKIPVKTDILHDVDVIHKSSSKSISELISENTNVTFRERLQLILASYGYEIDQNRASQSILENIEDLLIIRQKINEAKQKTELVQEEEEEEHKPDATEEEEHKSDDVEEEEQAEKHKDPKIPSKVENLFKDELNESSDPEESYSDEPPLTEEELKLVYEEIEKYDDES